MPVGQTVSGGVVFDVPNLTVEGFIDPGDSPGIATFNNLKLSSTTETLFEIAGLTPGSEHDQLLVTGDLAVDGAFRLRFIDGFALSQGQTVDLISVQGAISGLIDEDDVIIENLQPGFEFAINRIGSAIQLEALSTGQFIPEPTTLSIIVIGALAVLGHRRIVSVGRGKTPSES